MTDPTFAELGLAEPLLRALNDAQYTHPTPIQAKSIPSLLDGRDLLGLAETGTGKTAAFVLPMLQRLVAEGGRPQPGAPRALILAPTRELAIQIGESIHAYGRHVRIFHTVIFGGVGQRPQVNAIARGVDILVATPGRLIDLIEQRHLRLDQVRTFVLDEADRMLDMGFIRDVRRILKLVPTKRQSLLFSATMPDDIARLAAEILKDPVRVEIARAGKTVDRIDQHVMFVNNAGKRDVLAHLLQDSELRRVIVFTRTKRGADRVSKALEHIGVGVHAIHGNKSQGQRQSALDSFRKGFTRVLVATDIAARGIDIDEITHVINYELPNIPESYVHRIGRTARAGASGVAIALCAPDEREYLRDIERLTGRAMVVMPVPAGMARSAPRETDRDQATNGREHRAADRRPSESHRARDGARPHRDGAPRKDRPEFGRPRRDERSGAPARNGERQDARNGARQPERRNGEGHPARAGEGRRGPDAPRNGEFRRGKDAPRNGEARRSSDAPGRNGESRHGANAPRSGDARRGSDAPRNGDARRAHAAPRNGEAPRNGDGGRDAPQPWRNWTRSDGVKQEEPRRDRAPAARSSQKRGGADRRRDGGQGQGRGRDAR